MTYEGTNYTEGGCEAGGKFLKMELALKMLKPVLYFINWVIS